MYDGLIVVLVLVLIAVGLALLILPIVATVIAVKGRRRARTALARLDLLERDNAALHRAIGQLDHGQRSEEDTATAEAEPKEELAPEPEPLPDQQPVPPPETESAELAEPEPESLDLPPVRVSQVSPPANYIGASLAPKPEKAPPPPDDIPDEPPEPPTPSGPVAPQPPQTMEEKIGLVWFTRIGAGIGILVAGWFFKYTVDNDWIGPWGQVAIGWMAGAGLLVWGQLLSSRTRKQVHPVFCQGMLGLGLAVLLVSTYASFAFYHLMPVSLAFGVVVVVCLLGGTLAVLHRAEGVLVLSLLAALANPVMLSTGVDRPLALFAYLLVMTGGALGVSVRMGFRVATWISVAGVMTLFGGWYAKFFDPSPPPAPGLYDQPAEELTGAYFHLLDRWKPLLFAALFPLLWAVTGEFFRRREHLKTSLGLLLAGAVGAHAAYAALLYDHPIILGGVLCALGVGFATLLVRNGRTEWLGLPMLASFLVMASLTERIGVGGLLPMMLLTGGMSTIYFGVFFRTAMRQGWLHSARAMMLIGGAGLGLALLAGLWMLPDHFALYGLILAGLSAVYLWLALTVGSVVVILSAFVVSLVGMSAGGLLVDETQAMQVGFLVVAGLWFLIYLGATAVDLFVRSAPWNSPRFAVMAGVGVSFCALFLMATPEDANITRALLSLGSGICYLLIGLRMLQAGNYGQDRALLPLGMALSLFTLAAAFLLSGPSLTVAWAVEGAVLAWLASRAKRDDQPGHPGWLIGALVMFAIAILRMLTMDLQWIPEQSWLFWDTQGAEGTLLPTAFLHPRAWALTAIGIGLLLAAREAVKVDRRTFFRWAALFMVVAGHLSLLGLLVGEAQILFTSAPAAIPAGLPQEEFSVALDAWHTAFDDQTARMDTVTTVVLGLYSFVLLGIGFGFRSRLHRLMGLGLFGIALGKLGLYDIWALETLFKIVVGAAIAALLLAGAFLYGRFSDRIKTLLVEGDKMIVLLVAVVAALLAAPNVSAAEWERYAQVRTIEGVDAPGDYVLEIDPKLYGASQKQFDDVRIAGPDGRDAPFQFRLPAVTNRRVDIGAGATLLDPVVLPNGTTRVILDLGDEIRPHNKISLTIDGADYLRKTRVESSQDGKQWGLLADGGFVFHITGRCSTSQRSEIFYPTTNARYLRLSLLPGADNQRLRIRSAATMQTTRAVTFDPDRRIPLEMAGPAGRDGSVSIIGLKPLPANLPIRSLELAVESQAFVRIVEVEGSTKRHAWFPVGSGVIHRVRHQAKGDVQARLEEHLGVRLTNELRPHLRLRIENGDDPPLRVTGVSGVWRAEQIVFRARTAGPHTLHVGWAEAREPRYDLAEQRTRGGGPELRPASMGPLRPNPRVATPVEEKTRTPWTERNALYIQIGIGVLVLGLLLWTVVLIRRTRSRPAGD